MTSSSVHADEVHIRGWRAVSHPLHHCFACFVCVTPRTKYLARLGSGTSHLTWEEVQNTVGLRNIVPLKVACQVTSCLQHEC